MALLDWKPSYSLGIPSIDAEHRAMIGMINEVHARLDRPRNVSAVHEVLGEIHAGIAAHFALEERIMRAAAYAEYTAHKESHEQLLDAIRDLMDGYAADPEQGRKDLKRELSDWFHGHFATFDARLHGHLGGLAAR
jgi:hemerythrin-like metal-binding protein